MDRRGSGIGRILSSYTEFSAKPQFLSDETYFLVVLPNRSVSLPAENSTESLEIQLFTEKTQLTEQKTQLAPQLSQLSREISDAQDWEFIYFRDVLLKKRGEGLRTKTIANLLTLFSRYRYTYNFNRRNVADLFSISENGASLFINKCLKRNIIRKIKIDEYCFVSDF